MKFTCVLTDLETSQHSVYTLVGSVFKILSHGTSLVDCNVRVCVLVVAKVN